MTLDFIYSINKKIQGLKKRTLELEEEVFKIDIVFIDVIDHGEIRVHADNLTSLKQKLEILKKEIETIYLEKKELEESTESSLIKCYSLINYKDFDEALDHYMNILKVIPILDASASGDEITNAAIMEYIAKQLLKHKANDEYKLQIQNSILKEFLIMKKTLRDTDQSVITPDL